MAGQQICLKWNSFQTNIVTSFENLWEEEGLVDVTLASDGQCIRAHKVILSACSPFFRQVFQSNPCQHPVIILQDVHFSELESLLCFVYKGEVNIGQENLPALLKAAETLQIRGLSGASEQVKEKMAIPRKAPCAEEPPLLHPPVKRHRGCGTTTPPPPTPPQHQPPLEEEEAPPCLATPPLALAPKTAMAEGMHVAPCCGEMLMHGRGNEEGEQREGGGTSEEGVGGRGEDLVVEGGEDGGVGGEERGGEEGEEGEGDGGEEEEDEDEDRPLAHLSLKMEPPEFDYPCDSNSLPLALTLTLPNSAEEVNLPSVIPKARRVSDCHGDATLIKAVNSNLPLKESTVPDKKVIPIPSGEKWEDAGGTNGLQQRRRSRSRGTLGVGSGSGPRRKRRYCNNFIWRAPTRAAPLLPQVALGGPDGGNAAGGCRLDEGGEDGGKGGGEEGGGMLLLTPTLGADDDSKKMKKLKQHQPQRGSGVGASSDEEVDSMVAMATEGSSEGASSSPLPPYSLLPHACLLPSPSILSAWAKARTPEQLSCDLMRLLFSTEERLVCNVNGKMGKRRFDAHKVLLIREVVRHHYNECSGAGGGRHGGSGEEGGDESGERTVADFEERWKGCVTRIDTANRGLKRNLVLRGRKASFLV